MFQIRNLDLLPPPAPLPSWHHLAPDNRSSSKDTLSPWSFEFDRKKVVRFTTTKYSKIEFYIGYVGFLAIFFVGC